MLTDTFKTCLGLLRRKSLLFYKNDLGTKARCPCYFDELCNIEKILDSFLLGPICMFLIIHTKSNVYSLNCI